MGERAQGAIPPDLPASPTVTPALCRGPAFWALRWQNSGAPDQVRGDVWAGFTRSAITRHCEEPQATWHPMDRRLRLSQPPRWAGLSDHGLLHYVRNDEWVGGSSMPEIARSAVARVGFVNHWQLLPLRKRRRAPLMLPAIPPSLQLRAGVQLTGRCAGRTAGPRIRSGATLWDGFTRPAIARHCEEPQATWQPMDRRLRLSQPPRWAGLSDHGLLHCVRNDEWAGGCPMPEIARPAVARVGVVNHWQLPPLRKRRKPPLMLPAIPPSPQLRAGGQLPGLCAGRAPPFRCAAWGGRRASLSYTGSTDVFTAA